MHKPTALVLAAVLMTGCTSEPPPPDARRLHADSILRSRTAPGLLHDTLVTMVATWGDSSINRQLFGSYRHFDERRKRALIGPGAPLQQRIERVLQISPLLMFASREAAWLREEIEGLLMYDSTMKCTVSPARAEALLQAHPDWGDREVAGVACGSITMLRFPAQVEAAIGKPRRIASGTSGGDAVEVWVYDGHRIVFVNGRITRRAVCRLASRRPFATDSILDNVCQA